MNRKLLTLLTVALTGLGSAGLAQARSNVDVQWAVSVGLPGVSVVVPGPVYHARPAPVYPPMYAPIHAPVYPPAYSSHYAPAPLYGPAPGYRVGHGRYHPHQHRGVRHDADRDGIPDRYDAVYNPRWDRDGDGIPNRHDPRPYRPGR